MNRLKPFRGGANVAEQEAKALKAKADAMGVLIRAGVKNSNAAHLVGLSGVEFLDGRPVTLKFNDEG